MRREPGVQAHVAPQQMCEMVLGQVPNLRYYDGQIDEDFEGSLCCYDLFCVDQFGFLVFICLSSIF